MAKILKILAWIKANKRNTFALLALFVVVANQFGFADYVLDENTVIVAIALVNLVLGLLRTYKNV